MRLSRFWELMSDEFGPGYADTLARDHVLGALDGVSAVTALDRGVDPKDVWLAVCEDLDVPPERWLGRDRPPRPG